MLWSPFTLTAGCDTLNRSAAEHDKAEQGGRQTKHKKTKEKNNHHSTRIKIQCVTLTRRHRGNHFV